MQCLKDGIKQIYLIYLIANFYIGGYLFLPIDQNCNDFSNSNATSPFFKNRK